MDLTHDDVRKIIELIDTAEHLDEVELVVGGFRLHLRRSQGLLGGQPVSPPTRSREPSVSKVSSSVQGTTTNDQVTLAPGEFAVKAPMLGTFYLAPSPGAKPFVSEGQHVKPDDIVCMIEVMKLFNSIPAGVEGQVVKILVQNATLVEFNQPLIVIAAAK